MDLNELVEFGMWLKKGDKKLQREPVRPRTIETYNSILKNHLDCIPADESNDEIERVNDKLLDIGMYQLGVGVKLFCRFKGFSKETIKKIVIPKQKKSTVKFLTKEEMREIFEKFHALDKIPYVKDSDKPQLELLLHFLYETGGRINEVLNISFRDVEYKKDKLSNAYVVHLYEVTPDILKRGKKRDVMISEDTMQMLLRYMEMHQISSESHSFIFTIINNEDVQHMPEIKRLNYRKLLINRANLIMRHIGRNILHKEFTSHTIRHSTMTAMASEGVDVYLIKNYAGHNSILTTEKYLHAAQSLSKKAFKNWQDKKEAG